MPIAATTTKLHVTSNAKNPMNGVAENGEAPKTERDTSQEVKAQNVIIMAPKVEKPEDATATKTRDKCATPPENNSQVSDGHKTSNESASWLTWFSKSGAATEDSLSSAHPDGNVSSADKNRPQGATSETSPDLPTVSKQHQDPEPSLVSPSVQQQEASRSWLSLWGNPSTQITSTSSTNATGVASNPAGVSNGTESQDGNLMGADTDPVSTAQRSQQPTDGLKSSYGWAFWSRDQPKSDDEKTRPRNAVGELALAGSSSQSKPESAVLDEATGFPEIVGKRQGPQSLEEAEDFTKSQGFTNEVQKDSRLDAVSLGPRFKSKIDVNPKEKRKPENLLLPFFRTTYCTVKRPSLIQQISSLLQLNSASEPKHVNIVQNPPLIKKALAIVSLA